MKEKFKAFYEVDEEELHNIWESENTIFIFDTNTLLNLYQYSKETQNEFFKILTKIEGRIWIPFHVALEYQRRRLDVIRDEKSVFNKIQVKLDNIKNSVDNNFSEFKLKARNPLLFVIEEKFKADIRSLVDNFKIQVEESGNSQPCVRSNDDIRNHLDMLLKDKVGNEPTKEWIQEVSSEGIIRYNNEVPPGYKDANKDRDPNYASFIYNDVVYERKFGDLIIWKQIIEYIKKESSIENLVFITDDSKEDWWEIVDSGGKKSIGARPELKSEIYRETKINNFKMYRTNDFLTSAKNHYGIDIDNKAIEETEDVFNNSKSEYSLQDRIIYFQKKEKESMIDNSSKLHYDYNVATDKKEQLRNKLMNVQQKSFEIDDHLRFLKLKLAEDYIDKEDFHYLQEESNQHIKIKSLLEKDLEYLQREYIKQAKIKDDLENELNNLQLSTHDFINDRDLHNYIRSTISDSLTNEELNYFKKFKFKK